MRKIEVILRNGLYGVIDNGIESTPFIYHNKQDAIAEWEYFERLNISLESHRRFLDHLTPVEFIDQIVSKYI
ncbi:MAG: hypothetical protein AABY22_07930 [Nanoarchaeota archaeon]